MIEEKKIDMKKALTKDQIKMLESLKDRPITPDDDCPEQTEEELLQFRRISEEFNKGVQKQTVTLRLSSQSMQKAKLLGKGYTSILAQVLENALRSPETLEKSLHI